MKLKRPYVSRRVAEAITERLMTRVRGVMAEANMTMVKVTPEIMEELIELTLRGRM